MNDRKVETVDKVYDDIFEAIRQLLPNAPILNLKDCNTRGYLKRNVLFEAITMPNQKTTIFPRTGRNVWFYRGEKEDFPNCYPSLYRTDNEFVIMFNRLKTIDFMLLIKQFPPVYYARKNEINVDLLAIAQHYELPTDMLDLTSDISVAAFFATTYFDKDRGMYAPMSSGEGKIRSHLFIPDNDFLTKGISDFCCVGLQPFERPGRQCAFGIRLKQGQSFENVQTGLTVRFRHRKQQNEKILDIFGKEQYNSLFPKELITDVANKIKTTNCVTKMAIQQYCIQYGIEEGQVFQTLQEHQIKISDTPVFRLTRKQDERMRAEFRNSPFGGAKIYSRLMYRP